MTQFAESGFEPIDWEGALVHPMLRLRPHSGDRVVVTWESSDSPRVQGLGVRLRMPDLAGPKGYGGTLRVGAVESPAIMLWMDSAPPSVVIECVEVLNGAELRISNRWRLADGREDEWLNNYGMLVESTDPRLFVLRCSDGYGQAPTFDDLVVRVELISP